MVTETPFEDNREKAEYHRLDSFIWIHKLFFLCVCPIPTRKYVSVGVMSALRDHYGFPAIAGTIMAVSVTQAPATADGVRRMELSFTGIQCRFYR